MARFSVTPSLSTRSSGHPRRLKPLTISNSPGASAISAKGLRNVKYSQALEWVAAADP